MADEQHRRPRVVLDTTTLLQAIPTRSRLRPIIEAFEKHQFVLIISHAILLEYEEILKNRGGLQAWPAFQDFLNAHPSQVIRVTPSFRWNAIRRDPDDDKFVDAAVAGDAEWVITDDSHFDDLHIDTRLTVRPLHPEKFILLLRGQE